MAEFRGDSHGISSCKEIEGKEKGRSSRDRRGQENIAWVVATLLYKEG